MISEFVDRQATNTDLFELEDVLTGEKRQYRIVSKATVTQPGTDLNKATLDPILEAILTVKGIADSGGSASTGYWVKYDDGTMIWTATRTMSVEPFSASGSLYISSFIDLGTFPESFYGTPFVKAEQQYEPTKWTTSVTNTSSTSVGKVAVLSALATTNGTPLSIKCFAIGRWK